VHAARAQPRKRADLHPKRAQEKLSDQYDALRKYNSTIGFIGFPPSARLIIDKSANLDASSI
jgi:hypothetical protein